MTYREKMEAVRTRQAKELADLEAESKLAEALPVEPVRIVGIDWDIPFVVYKADTVSAASDILARFGTPLDVSAMKAGCLSVQPIGHHSPRYAEGKLEWEVSECIEFRQHSGRGFYSAEVSGWFVVGGKVVKVQVDVKAVPHNFRAGVRATYNRHGDVATATFYGGDLEHYGYSARIKYASGSPDAVDLRHYFCGIEHLRDAFNLNNRAGD